MSMLISPAMWCSGHERYSLTLVFKVLSKGDAACSGIIEVPVQL